MDYRKYNNYSAVTIRYMQTFLAAAEFENFSRAAELLGSYQPLVSRTISVLENDLGIQLFYKEGKNMKLTPEGAELYKYWQNALYQFHEGVESAHEITKASRVRIFDDFSLDKLRYLTPLVEAAGDKYPDIELRIEEHLAEGIMDGIRTGKADIGFTLRPNVRFMEKDQNDWKLLISSPLYAWVHETSLLYGKTSLTVEELADEPLVIIEREKSLGYNEAVSNIFAAVGREPNIQIRLPNTFSLEYYRKNGKVTYLANDLVTSPHRDDVMKIPIVGTETGLIVFWKKSNQSSSLKCVLQLIDELVDKGHIH